AVKVLAEGGDVTAGEGGTLSWKGDSATLFLAAATDYALDPEKNFRSGKDPASLLQEHFAASGKAYDKLREDHIKSHQELMGRVDLDIGAPPEGKPIDERLAAYKGG